jgi:hypothetical protein
MMESRSLKLYCLPVLLIANTVFCFLFIIIQIIQHNDRKKFDTITERSERIQAIHYHKDRIA